jgi:DNA (cytosine-5)-methyltransferase 1
MGVYCRYIQVGNAVAVPVARALGYCLGQAYLSGSDGSDTLCVLPDSFTALGHSVARASSVSIPTGEVFEQ